MSLVRKNTPAQDIFCESDSPSSLAEEVSQDAHDSFCDNESHYLLQLPQSLSTLNHIDPVSNVKTFLLRQAALLRGSILKNRLHQSGERKYPRKLIFIWDAGDSYGLKTFRSNFIYYVRCDIPVKGVTNINSSIVIGTTLHKFINSNVK